MSTDLPAPVSPHHQGRSEIDTWRGRCIDHFARGERAIVMALECARSAGRKVKLSQLASPRVQEVQSLMDEILRTDKQRKAAALAINRWRNIEPRRTFLAHGELTALLDAGGRWHARFDLTRFKANTPIEERWVLDKLEAEKFERELQQSFASLSQQAGIFRKNL